LGHPIEQVQVYVLDSSGRLVPVGVVGELYIAGLTLARGYQGEPALTAERFVPHPWSEQGGERLYRTGDLGRWRADGQLQFMGRVDQQLKLRGQRVEPGEIEAVLRQYPVVQQAVVQARQAPSGQVQLVGYVQVSPGTSLRDSMLRQHLEQYLPQVMIPSTWVLLERFPLTAHGKIDHAALQLLPVSQKQARKSAEPRQSETLEPLRAIWQEVLGQPSIGVDDNFFALGGDSILSIQIVLRARRKGLSLQVKDLFTHQTLAALAPLLAQRSTRKTEDSPQDEQKFVGPHVGQLVPLTPIQARFFAQELVDPHYFNQALLLCSERPVRLGALWRAVQAVMASQQIVRLRFRQLQRCWWQYLTEAETLFQSLGPCLDLSALDPNAQREQLRHLAQQMQPRLDLHAGPLMRVVLVYAGEQQVGRVLVIAHHLLVDTISWSIWRSGLSQAYTQASTEQPVQVPMVSTAYLHWAQHLQQLSSESRWQQQWHFWQQVLANGRPQRWSQDDLCWEQSAKLSRHLEEEPTRQLTRQVTRRTQSQVIELLLCGILLSWRQRHAEDELLLDIEGHGREEELLEGGDLSCTMGWFTTLFPLRLSATRGSTLAQKLQAVKACWRQVPEHGIGYGMLRYGATQDQRSQQAGSEVVPELCVNYLGNVGEQIGQEGEWQVEEEDLGLLQSPRGQRAHALELQVWIGQGRLQMEWTYSHLVHRDRDIAELAEGLTQALLEFLTLLQDDLTHTYIPEDFPEARLNQKQLDKAIRKLQHKNRR
jgi:non-ribosomal peptide synthase protein (TIGR01720 family)